MFGEIILGGLALLALVALPAGVLLTAFWIWMLVDAAQNKALTESERLLWILAIVFFHFIGSLLYLCIGRSKRDAPSTV